MKKSRAGRRLKQVSLEVFDQVWEQRRVGKLTVAQAAEMLDVSDRTFMSWTKELIENACRNGGEANPNELSFIKKDEE